MHIATHAMLSWLLAEAAPADRLDRRARAAITLAGIAPDLDGLGAPVEILSGGTLPWFSAYHHRLMHNGLACLAIAAMAWLWCRRDARVFALALLATHLWTWSWSGQWALNAWLNLVTTFLAMILITWLGARRGRTPGSLVHPGLDRRIVDRLRAWWGGERPDKS